MHGKSSIVPLKARSRIAWFLKTSFLKILLSNLLLLLYLHAFIELLIKVTGKIIENGKMGEDVQRVKWFQNQSFSQFLLYFIFQFH